ncbi:MAG: hypothetical protein LBS09_00205 [Bacteroidales bacterium]|nr:hypothetical protein [Bacteroidales bacterium]
MNHVIMGAMLFAVSVGFASCEKDDEDNPFDSPTIAVKATYDGATNKDVSDATTIELEEGSAITFQIRFSMGADKLKEVHLKSTISGKSYPILDSVELDKGVFNKGEKYIDFEYPTNVGASEETFTFTTKDTKDRSSSFTLTIKPKTKQSEGGFITKTITLLGAQNNASHGSFYSVALGKVLTIGAAKGQPGDVDFAYFYGSTNEATICAPSDTDGQTISYGTVKMSSWTIKNDTKFAVVSPADKDDPATWWDEAITAVGTSRDTKANLLSIGKVVAFKTAGGEVGAFVVSNVSGTQSGSISIQLVEKKN